jgi:pilus assembly protein CpaB
MRARSVALLLLALGCGLVASIGITQVIGKRGTAPADPTGETNAIFVALEDVPFGEALTPQVLRLESWPEGKVPAGALARIEDVEGRRTRTKLYAGEPILENKLFAKGVSEQGYSTMIPKGYRVVAVRVDLVSGSGLILPGDRVDVLVHLLRNPVHGILETTTRTILQDVKVFAVNSVVETQGQDEKTITAQTISLLVTPEHAQIVMLAEELGRLRLIMRSFEDDEIAVIQDITPSELFGITKAGDREQEGVSAQFDQSKGSDFLDYLRKLQAEKAGRGGASPRTRQMAAGTQHRMRLVSGPEVRDVVLERYASQSGSDSDHRVWRLREWESFPGYDRSDATAQPVDLEAEQEPSLPEDKPTQPQLQKGESD